jgi:hypothetical protein
MDAALQVIMGQLKEVKSDTRLEKSIKSDIITAIEDEHH